MIKKVVIILFFSVLLCGCTQSLTPVTVETIEMYNQALETSSNLNNYTMIETCQITTKIGEVENLNATTKVEIYMDKDENKKDGYASVEFSIQGVGTNEVEVWEKDNVVYLNNDGSRSINDVETMDVMSNITKNDFFKIITNAPITEGVQGIEKDNTILGTKLDEGAIIDLLDTVNFLPEDFTLKVNENSSEITMNKRGEITQILVSVQADIVTNEKVLEAQIDVKSVLQSIGNTRVQFPSDLDSYDRSKVTNADEVETLKNNLVANYDYIKTEDVYTYDWGTEKYVFDFDKNVFRLEAQRGKYDYEWTTDSGRVDQTGCLYDFAKNYQTNCSEEEIENIKLAKEIFENELNYNGITLEAIK